MTPAWMAVTLLGAIAVMTVTVAVVDRRIGRESSPAAPARDFPAAGDTNEGEDDE